MRSRASLLAAVFLALLAAPVRADESAPPYAVRDTNAARQALEEARLSFAAGDARRGIEQLQRLLDDFRDDLVKAEAIDASLPTRYVPAPEAARREILGLDAARRALYEEIVGPSARTLLDRASETRSEALLAEVLARYGATAPGAEAARRLAESAFERGAPRDAAAALREALRFAPGDTGLWLRLVDALAAARDAKGLSALVLPPESARARTAAGEVALAARLEQARGAVGESPDAAPGAGWDGGPAHDDRPPWDHLLRPLRWANGDRPPFRSSDDSDTGGNVLPESIPVFRQRLLNSAPYFPAVVGRRLVVADGFRVTAYDLLSGRVDWQFPSRGGDVRGLELVRGDADADAPAGRTNVEVAHVPCAADGLVFANVEVNDRSYMRRTVKSLEINEYRPRRVLVALDAGTGAIRWRMGEDSADERALQGVSLAGPPVAADGLVVATGVVFDKRWQASALCFEAATGRLRWKRDLVSSQQELNLFGEPVKELWAGAPAVADGVVYAPTGLGVLAALDLRTGAVRWLTAYSTGEIERVEYWYATPLRLPTWGPSPLVVHENGVLAAPADSPYLHCFDRADGRLRWRERSQTTRDTIPTDYFLGVATDGKERDVALVTGSDLRALDLRTGQFVWGARLSGRGHVRGRGAVSQVRNGSVSSGRIYVPTTAGLETFSLAAEGRIFPPGLTAWPEGAQPGNVILTKEVLVVAGGRSFMISEDGVDHPIQAFFDPEDIERGITARRKADPKDPYPALEAADLWRLVGQDARAESLYEEATRLATASGATEVVERAREGTYLVWRERGDAAASIDRSSEARSSYEAALARAATPAERVAARLRLDRLLRVRGLETARSKNLEALAAAAGTERARVPSPRWEGDVPVRAAARFLLADVHRAAGRPADAVDALQSVLRDDRDAILGEETAGARAMKEIAGLVKESGPGVYAKHEARAAADLVAASKSADPAPFESLLALYPNSTAVREAMLGLAERQAESGGPRAAAATLRRFLTSYPDHPAAPRALVALARAFGATGSADAARAALAALARRYPDARIDWEGRAWTGKELAAAERARLGEPAPPLPEATLAARPEDRWTEATDPSAGGARTIPIEGRERDAARLPVLVDAGGEIIAVDPARARARWRRPFEMVTRAVFAGESIVLGMRDVVVAVDPRTGEERWRRGVPGDVMDFGTSLGQVVALVRTPTVQPSSWILAIDPVTSDVAWSREILGGGAERLVVAEEGIAVLRLRSGGGSQGWTVSVHSPLTGETVGEAPGLADRWTEGAPRVMDGRTLLYVTREEQADHLVSLDLATARPRWRQPLSRGRGFVRRHLFVREGRLLVVDSAGGLRTFDATSGDLVHETAVTGGLMFVSDRCAVLAGGRLVALTGTGGRRTESQSLAAFDLETGRTVWSEPVKQVNQGLLLAAGDAVVAVLAPNPQAFFPRRIQDQMPEYQILRVDAAEGRDVVRITPRGLGMYPPNAVIQDGALVVAGLRAFAVYR